jgi:hypothetical protein
MPNKRARGKRFVGVWLEAALDNFLRQLARENSRSIAGQLRALVLDRKGEK